MSFDGLAPHYRRIEAAVFGRTLDRCRTALLPAVADARRALIVGEGDGRFLAAFLRAAPHAAADVLDASPRMVGLARRRVGAIAGVAGRVRFTVADARTADLPAAAYDLLVTHFFLDCFPADELARLVPRLAAAVAPGGRWLVGDFRRPPGRAAGVRAAVGLAVMYAFFRVATRLPAARLCDPAPLIRAAGFELCGRADLSGGFVAAWLWRRGG